LTEIASATRFRGASDGAHSGQRTGAARKKEVAVERLVAVNQYAARGGGQKEAELDDV
jgi:hypothetical protein